MIYTKPGCCLCDRAREQLSALQKRHSFDLRDVNILKDAEAFEKFKNEIPVIFVNGHEAFKYRLDVNAFLKLIRS